MTTKTTNPKTKTSTPKAEPTSKEVAKPIMLSEADAIAKYNFLKADVKAKTEAIEKAEVKDDVSYGILLANSTHLNKIIKDVEAKRMEVNRPALDFMAFNNEMAKQITADAKDAIPKAKEKLKAYDDIKAAEEAKKQAIIDKENAIKQAALDLEIKRKNDILASIAKLVSDAEKAINQAMEQGSQQACMEALKKCKQEFYTDELNNKDEYQEFRDEHEQALTTIYEMGVAAKKQIQNQTFEKVEASTDLQDMLEESKEAVQEEKYERSADIVASSMSMISTSHNKATYRTTWTFEVVDKAKVPDALKEVNAVAVNAWIANMKAIHSDELKNGNVINGIKIIEKKDPILR